MRDIHEKDLFFLHSMLDAIIAVDAHMEKGFFELVVQRAVTFELMTIGEAVTKLSDALKKQHSEVPWEKIQGTRHRIVHEYFHIDYDLVEKIALNHLPQLREQLEAILREME